MKHIIYTLIILTSLFTLYSCDLDKVPDGRAEIDSEAKIKKLLVRAYSDKLGTVAQEMRSDNTDENLMPNFTEYNDTQKEYYYWQPEVSNSLWDNSPEIWNRNYYAAAIANHVIEAVENLGETEELLKYKAEALLCRAYAHFTLANIFCMPYGANSDTDLGLPYATKPETAVNPTYDRGTVSELYKRINDDIEAALPYIDDDAAEVPSYHFNRKAAYAFAARFNLYYQNWDKVIEYSTKALGESPITYLRDWDYHAMLSSNGLARVDDFINPENPATFMIQATISNWGRIYYGTKYSHHKVISEAESLHSSGPWGIGVKTKVAPLTLVQPNPSRVVRKVGEYFNITNIAASTGQAYVIMAVFNGDETILSRAEAYIHKKEYDKAMADLNLFMLNYMNTRSVSIKDVNDYYNSLEYYEPMAPTAKKRMNADFQIEEGTQENLLHFTLHMRRILTMHEGLRMGDVNRYGITIYRRIIDANNNIVDVIDTMEKRDPRRALQIPAPVIGAGFVPNPQ